MLTTPPTLATLAGLATAGSSIDLTDYSYNLFGQVTKEVKTLASGVSETKTNSYDTMGHLVSQILASGAGDARATTLRYDLQGRLIGRLDGNGSTHIVGGETASQLDALYRQFGTTYTYDLDKAKEYIATPRTIPNLRQLCAA